MGRQAVREGRTIHRRSLGLPRRIPSGAARLASVAISISAGSRGRFGPTTSDSSVLSWDALSFGLAFSFEPQANFEPSGVHRSPTEIFNARGRLDEAEGALPTLLVLALLCEPARNSVFRLLLGVRTSPTQISTESQSPHKLV